MTFKKTTLFYFLASCNRLKDLLQFKDLTLKSVKLCKRGPGLRKLQ